MTCIIHFVTVLYNLICLLEGKIGHFRIFGWVLQELEFVRLVRYDKLNYGFISIVTSDLKYNRDCKSSKSATRELEST